MSEAEPCPCLTGAGPNCGDPNRSATMLGYDTLGQSWVTCTLPLGHGGDDHIYCGGGGGTDRLEWHGMYRWRRGNEA